MYVLKHVPTMHSSNIKNGRRKGEADILPFLFHYSLFSFSSFAIPKKARKKCLVQASERPQVHQAWKG